MGPTIESRDLAALLKLEGLRASQGICPDGVGQSGILPPAQNPAEPRTPPEHHGGSKNKRIERLNTQQIC
jgi:hypothetical protein